jgi:hypothetical protein
VPPTVPILQFCPSLSILKSVFKGASQCVPAVGLLYFGLFNPSHCSSLVSLTTHLPLFNSFQYVLCLYGCYVLWCYWSAIIHLSFPSFPMLHRVFPVLQTHSTYKVVYDRVCFVYIFIFGSVFHIWEKTCSLWLSEPGLLHSTWWMGKDFCNEINSFGNKFYRNKIKK